MPDISILSDQFVAVVRGHKHKNVPEELFLECPGHLSPTGD